jgi:uncharacterized peroxidase-related enzyme
MAKDKLMALDLAEPAPLPKDLAAHYATAKERLGFVPNVLRGYAHAPDRLANFVAMRDGLMASDSGLTKAEREMIAVVVSSLNRCHYCLSSHGATLRRLTGDPPLADTLAMNFRAAGLPDRQRAMLEFVERLTQAPECIEDADRDLLREQGFSERDIWDMAEITGFFNMINRLAAATGMEPNREYYDLNRR